MKIFFKLILFLIFTYGILFLSIKYYSWNDGNEEKDFNFLFNKIKDDKVLDVSKIIYGFYSIRGTDIYFQDSTVMGFNEDDYMKPTLQKIGEGYFDLSYHIDKADSIRKLFRSLNITHFHEEIKDSLYEFTIYLEDKYKGNTPHSKLLDSLNNNLIVLIYSLDSNFYEKKKLFVSYDPVRIDSVWYFSKDYH